jgi:hypothetical protein
VTRIYGLTGRRLPIHPQPLLDELLTHWFVRLAHSNGLKVQTLADRLFGYPSSFWARDQDKMASTKVIEVLADVSGKSPEDLMQLTLKPYGDYLYAKHNPNGNTRWILPIGVYHRTRRHGLQFCPLCLLTDSVPYFRKYWRLSFYVECDLHHVLMQDRCPNCTAAVMFHRTELGHRHRRGYPPTIRCFRCGFDLSRACPQPYAWADQQVMLATQAAIFCHFQKTAFLQNRHFDSAHIFFDVLYLLCNRLGSSRAVGELYDWVQQMLRPDGYAIIGRYVNRFEDRPIGERARILEAAMWLLYDWPHRLSLAARELDLRRKWFKPEKGERNTWILEALPLRG